MQDIRGWLDSIGLGEYANLFEDHAVEPWFVSELTSEDLREIGVTKVGHRRRILIAAKNDENVAIQTEQSQARKTPPRRSDTLAERRQLSVLFCDMVGSTQLSQQLDPEDLREVVRGYQDAVSGSISRYHGHIAKFLGDGVLAYFGWPHAREDQAERAVRAALDAVGAVQELQFEHGLTIEARAGIATGTVVIGDLVGDTAMDAEAIIGATPNLAARLQGEAQPGQVIIDPTTRRLIAEAFELGDLGDCSLKGFDVGIRAWRVLGEVVADSRFDVAHRHGANPLFGREAELQLLSDRLNVTKDGEGQVVYLSGEAGIGKSRLLRAMRDKARAGSFVELGFQCSPHRGSSAFYPVVQYLERVAGFSKEDGGRVRREKLEAYWSGAHPQPKLTFGLIATLLDLPLDDMCGLGDLTPQQIRDRTIEALGNHVHHLSSEQPVLLLFEDAHWVDPSTETLLGELVRRCQADATFIIITHRPEYAPPWPRYSNVTSIELNRLGRQQGLQIVQTLAGSDLPGSVAREIVKKAEGIPLYIEEIAKAVLEARSANTSGNLDALIPATLQASLNERLDRLGEAKQLAQTAAVIGREFGHGLLANVCAEKDIAAKIERLVDSELVYRVQTEPEPTYMFKHALVQNVAYDSLLRADRRTTHARLADILETKYPEIAAQQPEIIAHHCSEAGLQAKAIDYWERAGRSAVTRSAHAEAITNLRAALKLLTGKSECDGSRERELSIYAALGSSLMASKGYASEEVGEAYKHAFELSKSMVGSPEVFPAISGLWNYYSVVGDFDAALPLANQLLKVAETEKEALAHAAACRALGTTYHRIGKPQVARAHFETGAEFYDFRQHAKLAAAYGTDVLSNIMFNLAWCLWETGKPDSAERTMNDAKAHVQMVQHPFTTTWFYGYAAILHKFRLEPNIAMQLSAQCLEGAREQQLAQLMGLGNILHGWSRSMLGDLDDGALQLRDGIDAWCATGAQQMVPQWRCFLAECCLHACDPEAGLREIDQAIENIERTGQKSFESEAYRLKGELLLARSSRDEKGVEDAFETAIALAKRQEAMAYELRAAVSLGRLWAKRGWKERAQSLVLPIFTSFEEGFDTVDLVAARGLLEDCGACNE
jgi:predicted ATPase/class 3 adenylate cyclase